MTAESVESERRAASTSDTDGAPAPGVSHRADAPRLQPRPVYRPDVDAAASSVFGRPAGTTGSFGRSAEERAAEPRVGHGAPADPVLAEAFGRPVGTSEILQRPPADPDAETDADGPEPDPWRDPTTNVRLGAPAQARDERPLPPPPSSRCGKSSSAVGSRPAPSRRWRRSR